jgi:hypothetical protein
VEYTTQNIYQKRVHTKENKVIKDPSDILDLFEAKT